MSRNHRAPPGATLTGDPLPKRLTFLARLNAGPKCSDVTNLAIVAEAFDVRVRPERKRPKGCEVTELLQQQRGVRWYAGCGNALHWSCADWALSLQTHATTPGHSLRSGE